MICYLESVLAERQVGVLLFVFWQILINQLKNAGF